MIFSASATMRSQSSWQVGMSSIRPMEIPALAVSVLRAANLCSRASVASLRRHRSTRSECNTHDQIP